MSTTTQTHPPAAAEKAMDEIVALCKRRGFIFPASEIYGGINGFWDFGPLGVELKNNLRDRWWRDMVTCPPPGPGGEPLSIVGVDSAIIQNPRVWEASGHVSGFNDPMVDCRETKQRYRADHLLCGEVRVEREGRVETIALLAVVEDEGREATWTARAEKLIRKRGGGRLAGVPVMTPYPSLAAEARSRVIGPDTDTPGTLTEPRQFNLMFESHAGAVKDDAGKVYLRPETAQGIFTNFKNVLDTTRVRVPFGIAQIGKSFRNEVTPRNFIFRSREFEQMEMEWFCHPQESRRWYEFWRNARLEWWVSLGIDRANLRLREHDQGELAHYSTACADVDYRYPFTAPGFGELEGVAHRGCFDLTQHQEHSRVKLEYFDQERNERYMPHVVEPAAGLTRGVLVLICEAYTPDPSRPSQVYLRLHPDLAPVQAGVFPLVNKDGMPEIAERLYRDLRGRYRVQFDPKQSIGKRYARMDEIGAPFCFTADSDTLSDQTVTVRYRDTTQQERIGIDKVEVFLNERMK